MLSFIFVLPEILLSFGFMIYFLYSIYIKIDQRVLFYSVFSKVYQLFRLNVLNKFNLESLDLQDRILVIRKELSLKLNLEGQILSVSDRKSLLYLSFLCFSVFSIYVYQLYWFSIDNLYLGDKALLFNSLYVMDSFTIFIKSIIVLLCGLYYLVCYYLSTVWKFYGYEFGFFIFLIMFSMLILASSYDFFLLFISLELQSLGIVILGAFQMTQQRSIEAGLKYFIYGSFFSGVFLFAISLIYLLVGSLSFEVIYQLTVGGTLGSALKDNFFITSIFLVSFLIFFKLGVVPYHFWTPDVYQGSSLLVTTFLAVLSKLGLIAVVIRVYYYAFIHFFYITGDLLYYVAIFSMLIGALMALFQTDLRRFLAYSSVSNLGYVLLGISLGTYEGLVFGLFYFLIYIFGTLAFFLVILGFINKDINYLSKGLIGNLSSNTYDFKFLVSIYDLQSLYKTNKFLTFGFIIVLLNLIGVPPFQFFFAKYFLFQACLSYNFFISILVLILTSFISSFYYLRIIRILFLDRSAETNNYIFSSFTLSFIFCILVLLTLILFVSPELLDYIIKFLQLIFIYFH